jgi:Leucine-rich repeat (LRR) protein
LSGYGVGSDGIHALIESGHLPRLRALDLRENRIGSLGLQLLAESSLLHQVSWLDVRSNQIEDQGVSHLLRIEPCPRLAWLDLRGNSISRALQQALRTRFGPTVRFGSTWRTSTV